MANAFWLHGVIVQCSGRFGDRRNLTNNFTSKEGDLLVLTLADGTVIKVAVVGDAEFSVETSELCSPGHQ